MEVEPVNPEAAGGAAARRAGYRYGACLVLAASVLLIYLLGAPSGVSRDHPAAFVPPGAGAQALHSLGPFPGFPIDINTATLDELKALPGIGERTAGRILDLRAERGGFSSVDELLDVKWFGPDGLERVRGLVTAGDHPGRPLP